ncbi:unnamed protein product [Rhizophagus irregularis]|nr:unnamed protein product [Rhizophagus irregularis]
MFCKDMEPRSSKFINSVADLVIIEYNRNKKNGQRYIIHPYCHQRLEEIFNKTKFSLIWSMAIIFDEIKLPHCTITVNQRIIKLAEFMKGSLDNPANVLVIVSFLIVMLLKVFK